MTKSLFRGSAALPSRQRGVVLFIALIVMVVMSLAALGLIRSVDTTTAILGNLAMRQAAILPANFAVEDAAVGLFSDVGGGGPRILDVTVDTPAQNYFAEHSQAAGWDDPYGVPKPLQTKKGAQGLKRQFPVLPDGNTITYVTERMCNATAPNIPPGNGALGSWCDMGQPKQSPGTTIGQSQITLPQQVFYRVTVRVDGPQNTVTFLQAMLR